MTLVFLKLTVINIAIVFTTAFPTNIHETPDEISQSFDPDDGSGAPKKRQTDDEINLKVYIHGTVVDLNFKPTDGYLATRSTPVWSATTDLNAYNRIRYDPLLNAMEDIGEFKMYQDVDHEAAIVTYTDSYYNSIFIEGIVTSDYAIKSLPKRLWDETLRVGDGYFVERPKMVGRPIELEADEATDYVLFEPSPSSKDAKRSAPVDVVYNHREKRQRPRAGRRWLPEVVYPEMMIVLDHNAIMNQSITKALQFMLAFWNGVDMIYSTLDSPRVRLTIAGIIISKDDGATPYIAEDTSMKARGYSKFIIKGMGLYFYEEQVRFPVQYDIIIAMTTMKLCEYEVDPCNGVEGYANLRSACSLKHERTKYKSTRGTGVFHYNWMFGGLDTAAHEIAHLFGVRHDEGRGPTESCNYTEGFAMAISAQYSQKSFKWSPCSIAYFRDYFYYKDSECLDNEPIRTNHVDNVLPSRTLTLDGQCRNSGYEKACQIPNFDACEIHSCAAKGSEKCVSLGYAPPTGSKCGEKKYCDSRYRCVSE